jgi:hypothetical protein
MTTQHEADRSGWRAESLFHNHDIDGQRRYRRGISALRAVVFAMHSAPAPYPIIGAGIDVGDLSHLLDLVGSEIEQGVNEMTNVDN